MTQQTQVQAIEPLTLEQLEEFVAKQREAINRDRKAAGWPEIASWE